MPATLAQARDNRVTKPLIDEVWTRVFLLIDGHIPFTGSDAGYVATQAERAVRTALLGILDGTIMTDQPGD